MEVGVVSVTCAGREHKLLITSTFVPFELDCEICFQAGSQRPYERNLERLLPRWGSGLLWLFLRLVFTNWTSGGGANLR